MLHKLPRHTNQMESRTAKEKKQQHGMLPHPKAESNNQKKKKKKGINAHLCFPARERLHLCEEKKKNYT